MAPSYVGTCNSAAALILFYTQTVMVVVVFLNIQINERVKFLIINFISTFLYKISFRNQHACVQLYNMMYRLTISPNTTAEYCTYLKF